MRDRRGRGQEWVPVDQPEWLALNRAMWDERVPIHVDSAHYDLAAFRVGRNTIRDFELAEVGDVRGKTLLHLQCHIGLDTLSWARRGAAVTGLDFSEPAIHEARALARTLHLAAGFVAADVHDAVDALCGRTFDVVYTGAGALCWLPDLSWWAEVAAALTRPGGFVYLAEFHPFADTLDDQARTVSGDYFNRAPHVSDVPGTYADADAETVNNRSVEWLHGIGDVVTALAGAGLRVELLHEHDLTLFERFSCLERCPDGTYVMPPDRPRVPLMYSIRARRDR